ncbi:hypothetical protein MPTK1_2g11240 [Marchantia polymorpha subsp. ruderalis]|uniref:Uncharacterized protein n=1 Tax=Marchantia polymorpha TaxID=3197 RepID=A0A2R6XCD8_MARPO|nr:hypothetical protein MARPO_0023s0092 [Marchantia polymorpha]BBN01913.1 hypothetical protein Mp_2g11240 [Marchantia polymorpha subsp. ruderalis]|eukprot:PTQ43776.1 hypothetical protein MARPO_0023s0092 [Marchantia polymorpha]
MDTHQPYTDTQRRSTSGRRTEKVVDHPSVRPSIRLGCLGFCSVDKPGRGRRYTAPRKPQKEREREREKKRNSPPSVRTYVGLEWRQSVALGLGVPLTRREGGVRREGLRTTVGHVGSGHKPALSCTGGPAFSAPSGAGFGSESV